MSSKRNGKNKYLNLKFMSIIRKKSNLLVTVLSGLFLLSISVLVFNVIYQGTMPKIVEEINNSSIGAILTAIITVFLLSQQSKTEEVKERNSKIFEKKLEIYESFIKEIENLVKSEKISSTGKDTNTRDDIRALIFQLANIKMHTKAENITKVFTDVSRLITILKQYSDKEVGCLNYNELTQCLFDIVHTFQHELYDNQLGFDKENLDVDKMIKNITIDIIHDTENMGKDLTKYVFKGQKLGKGRLVLAVITDYVRQVPTIKFDDLLKAFPDELQGSINTIERLADAEYRFTKTKYKRHYLNENEVIELVDGPIAVCSQWGIGNIENFIKHCKNINVEIM